jgi:hypothetical protein
MGDFPVDDDAVLPDFHDRCENIISQVIVTEQEVIDMLCTLNANSSPMEILFHVRIY